MFETLEFEWRPRGRRIMAQARPRPHPRPWPRPLPLPPRLGFWPYRVPLVETLPLPDEEPWQEPDEELTRRLRDGVQRMPPGQRPIFRFIGSLAEAPGMAAAQGPGLYYFEFTANRRRRAYSGESAHMATRLRAHRQRAVTMGLDPGSIQVFVTDGPADAGARRAREKLFHERMFQHHPGFLTNQNRELELDAPCACARCSRRELQLAHELLAVRDEAGLDRFLGGFLKRVASPLGGILKGIAKKALPFAGGALGSLIPVPGVGTALGRALGGALSQALELELAGLPAAGRELEVARRFVRIAASAARAAEASGASPAAARRAVLQALRTHVPDFGRA
jgi:hypothetical protein